MGVKKSGLASSWLTAVKNAFTSSSSKKPAENTNCTNEGGANGNHKKNNKRREATEPQPQEQEKKRGKGRWIFGKSVSHKNCESDVNMVLSAEQRHAIAVAAATAATAEAAASTAQAAVEIVRLTGNSNFFKEVTLSAIVVIQTAFRGFLARKALRALKGLVKLQALVRGQNVRKQTKMTLQYIQALVRVQDQMRDHRTRLSHERGRRSSALAESNTSRDSRLHQKTYERRRTTFSGNGSGQFDNWEERSRALDEIDRMLQSRKEELMKREMALSYAFSQQIQSSARNVSSGNKSELGADWLDRWMAEKQRESRRASADYHFAKTVELQASKSPLQNTCNAPRPLQQINHRPASPQQAASPQRRRHDFSFIQQSPATPSTPKVIRPLQVRSASPRYFREKKSFSTTHTPKLSSAFRMNVELLNAQERGVANDAAPQPNYMTATESAKAKTRSQSAPRTRSPTPERDRIGAVKKRLSYQPEEHARGSTASRCGGMSQDLRIPSFKSFNDFSYGLEQQSNLSSYYTDSLAEEISPCSTTDLRRWLR